MGGSTVLVANAKLASRVQLLMRIFRYKPLPKTDTSVKTIQLQTFYYKVAILLVNISMFGNHNNHENRQFNAGPVRSKR